ncbi:MAG TPA: TRAP transporter large permease [Alphaproteobacteria bacterium]
MIVIFALFLALMALGFPVAFAMLVAALFHIVTTTGVDLIIVPQQLQDGLNSFPLLAVPFFILTGSLMAEAGVIHRVASLAQALIGHIRGGLAHTVVLAGTLMAGVSGSGTADAAALGSTMIPALDRAGYDRRFAVALTACAGALGPVIPPSIVLIIYGAMGNVSIGRLFLAGIIPGLLMAVVLMVVSHVLVVRTNFGAPLPRASPRERCRALVHSALDLVLPLGIVGGIRWGVFTPTEAGAIATAYVLLIGTLVYRTLGIEQIMKACHETVIVLGSVMLLIATASLIHYILALYQAADRVAALVTEFSSSSLVFLLLANLLVLILGCVMEVTAVLVLLTPILVPILPQFGIDPVHFGIVLCVNLTIGLITPPVGLAMFVTCSIGQISVEAFTRTVWPFLLALGGLLVVLILVPDLSLWLPHVLMN